MRTNVQLLQYLAEAYSEWEMLQTNIVEKMKKHFMFNSIFPKLVSCLRWYRAVLITDENIIWRMRPVLDY